MESYYRILNLSENCSRNEVVDSYRKLAVIHHPDKGGDSEKFKKISRAYEILTDKHKREKYDNSFLEDMYINYTDPDKIFEMVMKKSDEEVFRYYINNHHLHDDWPIFDDVDESYILKSIKKD
jgi:curved DNA-binding protein CbpA